MFFKISSNRKTPVLGYFFNKIASLKVCNFLKIDSNTGFSCGYCKIFKNSSLVQNLRSLLLTVLPPYSKVSWGVCSLISRLHVVSILIKNFHEMLHK